MKELKSLGQAEMIGRGLQALYRELGPVDARRFLALAEGMPREDSVKRHRRWQAGLEKEAFIRRVMAAQRA